MLHGQQDEKHGAKNTKRFVYNEFIYSLILVDQKETDSMSVLSVNEMP